MMNISSTLFTRRAAWGAVALAASATLAACGSSGGDNSNAADTRYDTSVVFAADRIEPLDTAATKAASVHTKAHATAQPALAADAAVEIALGALDATKVLAAQPAKSEALRIGAARTPTAAATADDAAALLAWQPLASGGQAAALRLSAQGAQGVRLAVDVQQLPAGAVLRFYGADGEAEEISAAEAAQQRAANEQAGLTDAAARTVWSQIIDGSSGTLEVELPAGSTTEDVRLAVLRLTHLFLTPQQALLKNLRDVGESGSCNLNVACNFEDISMESRATAKMVFDSDDGSYLCTGTLLNDTHSSRTPYFVTARHCIGEASEAASLVTYWFFRAASCSASSSAESSWQALGGGAQLLSVHASYDTTLLRLNRQPPDGVVYAGSYVGNALGRSASVLGVHHPSGDLQKYSSGTITGYASCSGDTCSLSTNNSSYPMFQVVWSQGTTEAGSSGSGLFMRDAASGTRYLAGVLHGGQASCFNRSGEDVYGRFGSAFYAGLGHWLIP